MATGDLVALIRHKQAEIDRLQAELDEARTLLGGGVTVKRGRPPQEEPQPGNSVSWALAVLEQAGKPLHVKDIIAEINRQFGVSVQYSTLVGNLARLVRAQKTFDRYGKNIFGLLAWREEEVAGEG